MLSFIKRRARRSNAGCAGPTMALLAIALVAGSAVPASAFVAASAWEDSVAPRHPTHGAHHRHAPSGANVIGRGIGGLHGDLATGHEASARTGLVR